jgi:hypothetical protein
MLIASCFYKKIYKKYKRPPYKYTMKEKIEKDDQIEMKNWLF